MPPGPQCPRKGFFTGYEGKRYCVHPQNRGAGGFLPSEPGEVPCKESPPCPCPSIRRGLPGRPRVEKKKTTRGRGKCKAWLLGKKLNRPIWSTGEGGGGGSSKPLGARCVLASLARGRGFRLLPWWEQAPLRHLRSPLTGERWENQERVRHVPGRKN